MGNGQSKFTFILNLVLIFVVTLVFTSSPSLSAKFTPKGPKNERMESSASPYLRSHSRDLVRWYSWEKETFEKAKKLDRPMLVSFGYTACHWCHVMQEKHFNDVAIAKEINEKYIPVLVDRERRSTLDDNYMLVTELMTRNGGWPNTVFMTHDLKPFFGTSYVPPQVFSDFLKSITANWANNPSVLVEQGNRFATLLTRYLTQTEEAKKLTSDLLLNTAKGIAAQFDPVAGGMGGAPKFFRPTVLMFLLQQAERTGDKALLKAVETTLKSAASGGIHDHIEGGFHRYTIDPAWRIPHFEKMLSDQALTAEVYMVAYRITGKAEYAATARKTLDYILADMTSPDGGFYTARDADSEGKEGTYYVWSRSQLEKALGKDDTEYAARTLGVISNGEFRGKVILNRDKVRNQSVPRLDKIFKKLGAVRKTRPKPIRDEKILVGWNGVTIASLALSASLLNEERYKAAAIKAGNFIWDKMRQENGQLKRSHFKGKNSVEAELEDYAQLARAYIFLFDLTAERVWLDRAIKLAQYMFEHFEDKERGDFYATRKAEGFGRTKPRSDIDKPSGNGAALKVLVRLARRASDPDYKRKTEKAIAALSGVAMKDHAAGASILTAADRFLYGQSGHIQYAGNGVVRVKAVPSLDDKTLTLRLSIAKGWHINADKPLEDHLIATKLKIMRDGQPITAKISYPKADVKKLAFNKNPVAIYEEKLEIKADLSEVSGAIVDAELEVQTCSDQICLLPEKLKLRVAGS